LQHGDVELLLAAEVVVDHALGGARASGDVVDPRTGIAALRELGGRDLEDVCARPFGVAQALGSPFGDRVLHAPAPTRMTVLPAPSSAARASSAEGTASRPSTTCAINVEGRMRRWHTRSMACRKSAGW